MLVNEAKLRVWAPHMLSVLRIVAALLFLQYGLSKYFGFPANPPAYFPNVFADWSGRSD